MSTPEPTPPQDPSQSFTPIATFDPIIAIDHFFRQSAHRALSVAIWLLAGRIVFAFWPRKFDFTFYLLPAAFVCLDIALIAACLSRWFAGRSRNDPREPRTLAWTSLALLVPTILWMLLPRLMGH
jgi:hypothetical protein